MPDLDLKLDQDTLPQMCKNFDLSLGKSPINIPLLTSYLNVNANVNKTDSDFLKEGFLKGFRIGFTGERVPNDAQNLLSARLRSHVLRDKINNELAAGRFAGPFKFPPISNLKISPVGLVPKSDGNWRLITHLSYPEGSSVNDGISDD